ncbi:MAG TPA: hydrogen peroxide-dependent heme synthase [Actinomycetes bacterium]|nr:hydrogen peroxide-dependent heme synthase [Actinomycetes bacterium]
MTDATSEPPATSAADDAVQYTMWSVFRATTPLGDADRTPLVAEVSELFESLTSKGVVLRGVYDLAGFRADADVMIWWHAPTSDDLQEAYQRFRRTRLGRTLEPVWSQMGVFRPMEFNRAHVPAFVEGVAPGRYASVYPYVRSYDWYLLPAQERAAMLAEHGRLARDYPQVHGNTVASFALGDFEWMLAFEAEVLHDIVDMMRHLRSAEARRHTRLEIPFYTGLRRPVDEIVATLP